MATEIPYYAESMPTGLIAIILGIGNVKYSPTYYRYSSTCYLCYMHSTFAMECNK